VFAQGSAAIGQDKPGAVETRGIYSSLDDSRVWLLAFSSAGNGETSDPFTKLMKRSCRSAIGRKRCFPGIRDNSSHTAR